MAHKNVYKKEAVELESISWGPNSTDNNLEENNFKNKFDFDFITEPDISTASATCESLPSVPPTTPAACFSFSHIFSQLKDTFSHLEYTSFPYVREIGVKKFIDYLGNLLKCPDYKLNLVQFWFLDVITDCVWQMQDEYYFSDKYQITVVQWILFVVDLIKDPQKNLSRKEFFHIFKEALVIAKEQVQTGCELLPSPDNLFKLIEDDEENEISFSSTSSEQSSSVSLMSDGTDGGSYIAVEIDESPKIFKLPNTTRLSYKPATKNTNNNKSAVKEEVPEIIKCEDHISTNSSTLDFYQPDLNTPERFKSPTSSSPSIERPNKEDEKSLKLNTYFWKHSAVENNETNNIAHKMSNLSLGLSSKSSRSFQKDLQGFFKNQSNSLITLEQNIMVNNCVLEVIEKFVFDYFSEPFQYFIIQMTLLNQFTSITENINTEWNIPKIIKKQLKKPKQEKEKKISKKTLPKISELQKLKQKKPIISTKEKDTKNEKKIKTTKPAKPTKAEKEELLRQKREQQKLAEEMRLNEANRRLLLPLQDAADDDFFKSIFDHWVKPNNNKKKQN